MKTREYCCCAIPLVNPGIYAVLIEQTAAAVLVATLSITTTPIVGAATPSFAKWILAIVCYLAAAVQLIGVVAVRNEKPSLYGRYVKLHGLITGIAFSVALTWIILSATRHSTARDRCIADFFTELDGSTPSEATTLCTIFPWVDVGVMAGLWVLLAIVHIYFYIVISSYGKSQRNDHDQYDRVYESSQPLTGSNIPLESEPWDKSNEQKYKHLRQQSSVSASDILSEPRQEPKDTFAPSTYNYDYDYDPYAATQPSHNNPSYPSNAHMQTLAPTPTNNYYYNDVNPTDYHVERPMQAQSHPAEGSFRRKTPRLPNPY